VKKVLVLIAVAMPGLQRLYVFLLAGNALSLSKFGEFSSDYSVVQVLSFFSAIGWSGVILTRVPKLSSNDSKIFLANITRTSLGYYFLYTLVLVAMFFYGVLFDLFGTLFFLITWMVYQLARHYAFARTSYNVIIVADVVFMSVFTGLALLGCDVFFGLSIGYLLSAALLFYKNITFKYRRVIGQDVVKSFEISGSNFLSTSTLMGLPFIVSLSGEVEYSAFIGSMLSILGVLLLLPRGFSVYLSPILAKMNGSVESERLLKRYFLVNSLLIILVGVVSVPLLNISISQFDIGLFALKGSKEISIALVALICIGTFSGPVTTYLLSTEETKKLLWLSLSNFILSFLGILLFYVYYNSIVLLIISMCLAGIFKLLLSLYYVRGAIFNKTLGDAFK